MRLHRRRPQPSHGARRAARIRRLRPRRARRGAQGAGRARRQPARWSCSRRATAPRSTRSANRTPPPTPSPASSASITSSITGRMAEHLYTLTRRRAARHLFRVAAGLDSLVVGEPQILGQVKAAYTTASDLQFTGAVLNRLFHSAFAVGKRVRTRPGSAKGPSRSATPRSRWRGRSSASCPASSVLILGAGEMAKLTAIHLQGAARQADDHRQPHARGGRGARRAARAPAPCRGATSTARSRPPTSSSPRPARPSRC